jgi:bacteriochlorophyll 4-vinyl reductase
MSDARIGRVLVASLHQAIADLLPSRLEFYEHWLNSSGLREGTIGLAQLSAVLSFLRSEGEAYALITRRAGEYAADWTFDALPSLERRVARALPAPLRMRAALRFARGLVRSTYAGSRAVVRVRRGGQVTMDIRGSLFCTVRRASVAPLCGYYASAVGRFLHHLNVRADAQISGCRAAGGAGCVLFVTTRGAGTADDRAVAA